MRKWKHWCPKGCGKKAFYIGVPYKKETLVYQCQLCGYKFNKKQIEEY